MAITSIVLKNRVATLQTMYDIVEKDDEMYAVWIQELPDEPDYLDLCDIAEDEGEWERANELFEKVLERGAWVR